MIKKLAARKDENNLSDIYKLLSEIKGNLKVVEAKNPYNNMFSSSLELAIRKISIAEKRLSAEGFIDGLCISEIISYLKKRDPFITKFTVVITKLEQSEISSPPYDYQVLGS